MTAKETLHQHVSPELTDKWGETVLNAVLMAMGSYARQQAKKSKYAVVASEEEDTERNFNRNSRW
jgi:hypothetical protein